MISQISAMSRIAIQRVAAAYATAVFAAPVVEALHHLGVMLQSPAACTEVMDITVQFVGSNQLYAAAAAARRCKILFSW